MTRAHGSLGVPVGPTNSHLSLQGDILILCHAFSQGRGRFITFPLDPSDYPHPLVTPSRNI